MRPFWIILLILVSGYYLAELGVGSIRSGRFEKYLDSHPRAFNPRIEYCLASVLRLANKTSSSMRWYQRVYTVYPESEWAPHAWAANLVLLKESGKNPEFREGAEEFLLKYPDHPKAVKVRKKLMLVDNVY